MDTPDAEFDPAAFLASGNEAVADRLGAAALSSGGEGAFQVLGITEPSGALVAVFANGGDTDLPYMFAPIICMALVKENGATAIMGVVLAGKQRPVLAPACPSFLGYHTLGTDPDRWLAPARCFRRRGGWVRLIAQEFGTLSPN